MKYIFIVLLALSLSRGRLANEMDSQIIDFVKIAKPPTPVLNKVTGTLVELECEAVGSPPPTVEWLEENRPITENKNFNDVPTKGLARLHSRLAINSPHKATYTCVASSGSQKASSKRNVYLSSNEVSDQYFSQLLADQLTAVRNQPRIILYYSLYMYQIGSDIVLPCKAIGNPRPSITWMHPLDVVMTNGPRWSVYPNGDLSIRNMQENDMGAYTCVAKNTLGQDNVTTFLYPMLASKVTTSIPPVTPRPK